MSPNEEPEDEDEVEADTPFSKSLRLNDDCADIDDTASPNNSVKINFFISQSNIMFPNDSGTSKSGMGVFMGRHDMKWGCAVPDAHL